MKTTVTVSINSFEEQDMVSMFGYSEKTLSQALTLLKLESAPGTSLATVVKSIKTVGLDIRPNCVIHVGNSKCLAWAYQCENVFFVVDVYYRIHRSLKEVIPLDVWYKEQELQQCEYMAKDTYGKDVCIIGWAESDGLVIVRPLKYPAGMRVAFMKDDIVHYARYFAEVNGKVVKYGDGVLMGKQGEEHKGPYLPGDAGYKDAMRKQHEEWIAEAEAEKKGLLAKDPNKQNLFF